MNQKRKADLQRKLSMTSVPRPPAGLVDRIKADIPGDLLSTERDRARFSRTSGWTIRVAASVILLISSAYLALQFVAHNSNQKLVPASLNRPPAIESQRQQPVEDKAAAPQAEVTITLADSRDTKNSGVFDAVQRSDEEPAKPPALVASRKKMEKDQSLERQESNELREAGIAAAREPVSTVADAAPVAAPPPPPPTPAPAAPAEAVAQAGGAVAQRITVTAAAPSVEKIMRGNSVYIPSPRAVFGLSVDPAAFDRVKQEIEQGARPVAGSVDVAALVNYFAGSGRPPRSGVRLDVEASRAPLAADNTALLRFTVDTPHQATVPGASLAPAATDANLDIWLNSQAIASHRLVGAGELKAQATLQKNLSVTGLVDVKLKPGVQPRTTIARLTLRYRSVDDGKWYTLTQSVRAADVTRTWAAASRRHRLATLGAVWSESLNGGTIGGDVAGTAEKLATESPNDARARDLATVTSAFSRLQSSGPTGSGR